MNRTKYSKIGFVLGGALLGYTAYAQPSVSAGMSVQVEIRSESDFYEPLTSYGRWEVVGSYGRCWIPSRVETDWRPYSDGYWQRTDAGWYWASDEPWAWATYHYGRWDLSAQFGWYWVPQTQWAPAWVSWHRGGGYIGWAPLYPSARFAGGGSLEVDVTVISPRAYVFVEEGHFLQPVRRSAVVVNNTTIINKTVNITNIKVVNNTVINEGPATAVIEKASGRKLQAVPVQELRHKAEAPVVAKQRTPTATSETIVQPPLRNEAQVAEKKAVPARAPPQVEKTAATTQESAAPAAKKKDKAQSGTRKPVPAAAESKPAAKSEAKPEDRRPSAIVEPSGQNANKQPVKGVKSARASDKQAPAPKKPAVSDTAKEKPAANEEHGAKPADKDQGKKVKE